MVRKESFDTIVPFNEPSTIDHSGNNAMIGLADMVPPIFGTFQIIAFTFNPIGTDLAIRKEITFIPNPVGQLLLIKRLAVKDVVLDFTMDNIVRITADWRSEVTIGRFS